MKESGEIKRENKRYLFLLNENIYNLIEIRSLTCSPAKTEETSLQVTHKWPPCTRFNEGVVLVVIVWYLDLQLPMQSVPIISNVVSFNPTHGEAYSIQHYVIKFVSDLRHVGGFLRVLLVSSTNKIHRHDITEIMLKVVLCIINQTNQTDSMKMVIVRLW